MKLKHEGEEDLENDENEALLECLECTLDPPKFRHNREIKTHSRKYHPYIKAKQGDKIGKL